jgi:hypothetical protein
VRGQSAEVVFNGGAGDVSAAVVVEYVEGQDLGGGARVEHAHREFNTFLMVRRHHVIWPLMR